MSPNEPVYMSSMLTENNMQLNNSHRRGSSHHDKNTKLQTNSHHDRRKAELQTANQLTSVE